MVLHSYLYHIGEPQRDDEIDGEERGGEGGNTETMYECMYVFIVVAYKWFSIHTYII